MEQFNICLISVEFLRVYMCIFIYIRINNCCGFWGLGGKKISVNISSLKLVEFNQCVVFIYYEFLMN